MYPYLYIGEVKISLYYSAMILGYVMMVAMMLLKKRREMYDLSRFRAACFATIEVIFGVVGCKILYILENFAYVRAHGFTFGGFSFYGAVFILPLVMPLVGRILKLRRCAALDSATICMLAMLGTIRLGCYLNGCCGGKVFCIGDFYFTFPVQLIECILDFGLLYVLLKWEEKGNIQGFLYTRFLLLYGSARFLIEFLRNTTKDWLGFSHAQWFSVVALLVGVVFELRLRKQGKKLTETE